MTLTTPAIAELRAALRGPVLFAGDEGYHAARRVWNRGVDRYPAAIAHCADEVDVATAVRFARARGLPLSVRGGGHDWAGRSLRDGGLVLDLRAMRGVAVDGPFATVGGGAMAGEVAAAARAYGLAPVTGTVSQVGMAGLTLGGGYGPLLGRYGLALDNVVSARVVLADGTTVTASATESPDLFWALRGGGGNFGVVTELQYQLHPHPTVLAGTIVFPLTEASSVLRGYRDLPIPDDLTVIVAVFTTPDGPVLALLPTWCGDPAAGERLLTRITSLGRPLSAHIGQMTVPEVLGQMDGTVSDDRHTYADSRWLPAFTDPVVDLLATEPPPYSAVAVHHFHGAACRAPAAAWALRTEHLQVEIIASGPEAAPREWATELSAALEPHALPGGYPNLLGPEAASRVRAAHGAHLARLAEVKRKFDPDGVFAAVAAIEEEVNS